MAHQLLKGLVPLVEPIAQQLVVILGEVKLRLRLQFLGQHHHIGRGLFKLPGVEIVLVIRCGLRCGCCGLRDSAY